MINQLVPRQPLPPGYAARTKASLILTRTLWQEYEDSFFAFKKGDNGRMRDKSSHGYYKPGSNQWSINHLDVWMLFKEAAFVDDFEFNVRRHGLEDVVAFSSAVEFCWCCFHHFKWYFLGKVDKAQQKKVSKWNVNLSDFMQMELKVFSSHTVMTDSQQEPQPGCAKTPKNCFHFSLVKQTPPQKNLIINRVPVIDDD